MTTQSFQKISGTFFGLTLTMYKKTIIYLLPHYDDEMFVIPKIVTDLKNNYELKFFFLMKSEQRLKESQKYLTRLGVYKENIITIGEILDVEDGFIHLKIESIYTILVSYLEKYSNIDEIVSTAYEGGHNDHDMASLIARCLAQKFKIKFMEFYLYNGNSTRGKFYQVASPIQISKIITIKYSLRDFLTIIIAPIFYKSQMNAMLGLWPFLLFKILLKKPLTLNVVETHELFILANIEIPLYERWGRISQSELRSIQDIFVKTYKE